MDARTGLDLGIPFGEGEGYRRPVEFRVLGALEVVEDGNGAVALGGPKQRAILANLLLRANTVIPTEVLIDDVWGEEQPDAVRNSLQAHASHLRKALGPGRLEGSRAGYVLRAEPREIDAHRFESLLRDAARLLPVDPKAAVGSFENALSLWRGPAFGDLATEPSISIEAARLDELRLGAIEDRIEAELTIGEQASVTGELETLTAQHPLRERLWGQLMLALYRAGRQAEALAAFQRARETLAEELGIDPSPELRRLHERILQQSPDLDVGGAPLRGYRLLERVGVGGYGAVWRAIQPEVGRDVAIKSIHPHLANDPAFIRRFEAEAQLVARLEHPHVVPLYDYWREPGGAYLVMRFLRGGSLADALTQDPLQVERVTRLVDQVGSALAAAHRQGVIHRDVKPSNILLDEEGNTYLADFGIAKDLAASERTAPGIVGASLLYAAPEQIRGEAVTPRTDLYALGIVLYEALVGEHPFADAPDMAVIERHLRDPLPRAADRRTDLPAGVDEVIATATTKDPELRFPDAESMAVAFREAVASTTTVSRASPLVTRNPYKGLRPFAEADANDFFGREAFVERLLDRMRKAGRFLAVVGPSGSGKSSAVRAGLVPAIRGGSLPGSEGWFVTEMLPGHHPIEELESALLRVAARPPVGLLQLLESGPRGLLQAIDRIIPAGSELLLVVDQFEELFTLAEEETERSLVLESLRVAAADPGSRVRIVATLRGDFYDRPLNYPRFGELLGASTEVVTPLAPDELERAIVRPAEAVGIRVEPALVAQIVGDVTEQPGALPLVQYTLTELFERHGDGRLTLTAYHDIGGVGGALAARAEQLYLSRQEAGRDAARQLFLRLVTLGEGVADTRRRVPISELWVTEIDPEAMKAVLEAFGRHRLLTFDRDPATRGPTVEVAHEALLRSWPRLRAWVDAAREDVRMLRRLEDAAVEWERNGREPSYLLRGSRLDQFESWVNQTDVAVGGTERAYLKMSVGTREEERATEQARRARERTLERRSVKRLRALVALFAAAALVAGTLTAVVVNRNKAAQRAVRLATARELAGAALRAVDADPQLATLLALEAIDTTSEDGNVAGDAEFALRRAMPFLTVESLGDGPLREVSYTRDLSRLAIVDDSGPTAVWDFSADQPGRRVFTVPTEVPAPFACPSSSNPRVGYLAGCDAVFHAALSPDGAFLATGHGDRFVRVWDLESGRTELVIDLYARLPSTSDLSSAAAPRVGFSPDGRYLWTVANFGDGIVWDAATGEEILRASDHLNMGQPDGYGHISISEDSRFVAFRSLGTEVWDLEARRIVLEDQDAIEPSWPPASFSDQGLVTIGGGIDAIGLESVVPGRDVPDLPIPRGPVSDFDFSPDGARFATAGTSIHVWDVETKERVTLGAGLGRANALAWSPDSRYLATGWDDGTVRIWDVDEEQLTITMPRASASIVDVAFTPVGSRLAVASADGVVSLHVLELEELIEQARDRVPRGFTDEECQTYLHVPSCPTQ
jgi:serine/threonine protein kinase/WD40 repeat protein/DNA-binding winged helix-turn-helix (wHTH) protein